jgi:hypothetical protein
VLSGDDGMVFFLSFDGIVGLGENTIGVFLLLLARVFCRCSSK